MRLRIEAKLRKGIRQMEHWRPGLQGAIARRESQGASLAVALSRFAVDPAERRDRRIYLRSLISRIRGAEDVRVSMLRQVVGSGRTDVKAEYLRLCSNRENISPTELALFREVIATGSSEEQIDAIDGVAFIRRRAVRYTLIDFLDDQAVALEVRERAAEMLHLHPSKETADACARALGDPHATIRFWAAYTLGEITVFRKGLRELAASALTRVLNDHEVAPGWWSVGREARAMIVVAQDNPGEQDRLQAEIQSIQQDANASPEDRRWAECYSTS